MKCKQLLTITLIAILNINIGFAQDKNDPELIFEYLWKTYDRNYALFEVKNIDWDALYNVYRPKVNPNTTEDELFDILSDLIGHLNDNHVWLRSKSLKRQYRSGLLGEIKMVDPFSLLQEKYLNGNFRRHMCGILSGWLTDSIGYFHIQHFNNYDDCANEIDAIIHQFKDAKGIVVDVRENYGGDDVLVKVIADRFADKKRLYHSAYLKNGDNHNDFTSPIYWYVEPNGPRQFLKPVILLTNRFSLSGAENFTLAMKTLPHVTVVGEATSGSPGLVYRDELPNGWTFKVVYGKYLDNTGFCWEGIGIPADIKVHLTNDDLINEQEKVLDLAIELINLGNLQPQIDSNSLIQIRESLVDIINKNEGKEINKVIDDFLILKSSYPNKYYIDQDKINELGNKFLDKNEFDSSIRLFKISTDEFPKSIVGYDNLVTAHTKKGDLSLARKYIEMSMNINRQSYPWEKKSYKENKQKLN
jgi:peptidase S41-like protein/tricorn protease-like protein